ncbi:MAG: hypothetical protein H7138_20245, partial [Myxococcales bacterium]|nr:hypothetical protein [Myxococcales bacterium]
VQASLEACQLVAAAYPEAGSQAPRSYIDGMLAAIARWLADPSREHREVVRSSLDVHRQAHAWQNDDAADFWILEAVDHACLTVWAGDRASYIIPVDFATTAGRVIACVFHAMRSAGQSEQAAADAVIDVVLRVTA